MVTNNDKADAKLASQQKSSVNRKDENFWT